MKVFVRVCASPVARGRACDRRLSPDQMGMPDAISGRQFPHQKRHPVRRRRGQGDKRLAQDHGAFGGLADQHPEIKRTVAPGTAPNRPNAGLASLKQSARVRARLVPFLATGRDDASPKLYDAQKPYLEKQLNSEG